MISEKDNGLDDSGIKILNASKQELYMSMRYLFELLNMFQFQVDKSTFFVGTDGKSLYFNPMMTAKSYMDNPVNINRAYMHMILHCMFRNIFTERLFQNNNYKNRSETDVGSHRAKQQELWNVSCDIAVEYILDGMEESSVKKLVSDKREAVYIMLRKRCGYPSAENVYQYLTSLSAAEQNQWRAESLFLVDDHKYWYALRKDDTDREENSDNKSENSAPDDQSGEGNEEEQAFGMLSKELEEKWEKAGEKLLTELTTFGSGAGDLKRRLTEGLTLSTREKYSYRDFLRKFTVLKEEMHVDQDTFDFGFYNYGMQTFGNMPLIEELEYREENRIEEFVIVIDTSGSCAGEPVKRFLEETYGILAEQDNFFNKVNIHILQCDNLVQSDTLITDLDDLGSYKDDIVISGYGGTDFRPAFEYVNHMIDSGKLKNLKGLLYFTDGYGTFPRMKPSYLTAFVFYREYESETQVPPWALKIELHRDYTDRVTD